MAKRSKRYKYKMLRWRKDDHEHNLLVATQKWLISQGSYPVVVGGIGILDEYNPFIPGTSYKFKVCVSIMGDKPKPKAK